MLLVMNMILLIWNLVNFLDWLAWLKMKQIVPLLLRLRMLKSYK